MKILIVSFLFSIHSFGQTNEVRLDSLRKIKIEYTSQLDELELKISNVDDEIKLLEILIAQSRIEELVGEDGIPAKLNALDAILRKVPNATSEKLLRLKAKTDIKVLSFENGYFRIEYNRVYGYVFWPDVKSNPQIAELRGGKSANKASSNHTIQSSYKSSYRSSSSYSSKCGARNKTGGYCKNMVKGGGRCHHHR